MSIHLYFEMQKVFNNVLGNNFLDSHFMKNFYLFT